MELSSRSTRCTSLFAAHREWPNPPVLSIEWMKEWMNDYEWVGKWLLFSLNTRSRETPPNSSWKHERLDKQISQVYPFTASATFQSGYNHFNFFLVYDMFLHSFLWLPAAWAVSRACPQQQESVHCWPSALPEIGCLGAAHVTVPFCQSVGHFKVCFFLDSPTSCSWVSGSQTCRIPSFLPLSPHAPLPPRVTRKHDLKPVFISWPRKWKRLINKPKKEKREGKKRRFSNYLWTINKAFFFPLEKENPLTYFED